MLYQVGTTSNSVLTLSQRIICVKVEAVFSENVLICHQYNFAGCANTFAGMIQTESPYFQYAVATESPGPFDPSSGLFNNDPSFPDNFDSCTGDDLQCNFSWSIMFSGVNNLTIAGAGLYSWFDAYDKSTCVDAQDCQQRLINDQGDNNGLFIWNLITIGSVEMISDTSNGNAGTIFAAENTQLASHPYVSAASGLSLYCIRCCGVECLRGIIKNFAGRGPVSLCRIEQLHELQLARQWFRLHKYHGATYNFDYRTLC